MNSSNHYCAKVSINTKTNTACYSSQSFVHLSAQQALVGNIPNPASQPVLPKGIPGCLIDLILNPIHIFVASHFCLTQRIFGKSANFSLY
jgi:hypothetical protein